VFDIDLDIELGNTEEEMKDDPGKRRLLLFFVWNCRCFFREFDYWCRL